MEINGEKHIKKGERLICEFREKECNCPLENINADPNTFCKSYKEGDGYICNAAAMEDPSEF
jgi:hypothetical protein